MNCLEITELPVDDHLKVILDLEKFFFFEITENISSEGSLTIQICEKEEKREQKTTEVEMLNYHSTMLSLLLLLSVIKVDFNVAVEIYSHSRVSKNGNQIIFQSDMRNRTSDRLPTRATDIDSMLIDKKNLGIEK
ncbi:CLUMA_CG016017, isoform A [Clunio marinus]|uniref:CLUMA_CG016017, isoform A n=1 Tax=Clunio marinus TaxID=568069 RepID=A0A1J1IR06_9DIPT|nr:CLUMA_CG016017, isoform A [Clunio marinus]